MPDFDSILKWEETRWRQDTEILSPLARGVYRELIGYLHLNSKRCGGVLTGSRDELARAGRCSTADLTVTLDELQKHHIANLSECNGSVTIVVRRMKREAARRQNSLKRVQNWRKNEETPEARPTCQPKRYTERNNSVTPKPSPRPPLTQLIDPIEPGPRQSSQVQQEKERSSAASAQVIQTENLKLETSPSTKLIKLTLELPALDRIAGEIISNKHDWWWDNCKLKPADFPIRKSLSKILRDYVGKITEPQVHAAWAEAVKRTHQSIVDEMPIGNPAGYCIQCWREALQTYNS
jgi:bacterioferritin-associated ferredoxin